MKRALAFCLMMTLTGCAGSTPPEGRVALPAAPANFGRPVALPTLARGESLRHALGEHRAALHTANTRLDNDAAFYEGVRRGFGK